MDAFVTPNALFFKRNHLPVPDVKAEDYLLEGQSVVCLFTGTHMFVCVRVCVGLCLFQQLCEYKYMHV